VQLQVGNLVDHLTLGQNIALAQRLAGTVDGSVAAGVLQRTGLDDRVGARPGTLSGGELARAGLAVALANSPAVIVLDEPTGELDSERTEEVMSLVAEITGGGTAAVIVSHDARTAASADRAIELLDGAVVAER
jgi:putative ABC transport system ATP-binding protein